MEAKKNIKMIHYIIVMLLCFGFRFLPPFAGITELGMGVLGAFLGAIYGWVFIDLAWPSFMAITATGLSVGMSNVIAGCFGNETFLSLIIAMIAIGPAIQTGAFNWLAMKLLNSKALEGKGFLMIFAIFVVAWLLASANSLLMAIVIFNFINAMFKQVGIQKNDKLVVYTYIGIAYQIMRGQILFPFYGTGLIYLNAFRASAPNMDLPVMSYLAMMFINGLIMTIIFVLLMKFVFRCDASPLSNYKQEGGVLAATREQKITLIFFVTFIVLNLLASVGPLKPFLSKFGLTGITFVLGCLMVMLKDGKGEPLSDVEKMMHMNNLGLAIMIGYVMWLAVNFATPETGIGNAVAALFMPFTTLPPLVFVIVVMIIALIATNFLNNMMVAVVCLPFMINFTSLIGMEPMAAVVLMFIITEFALCTPAASPITALSMGQELADTQVVMKASIPMVLILFVCFLVIGWPLANFIF